MPELSHRVQTFTDSVIRCMTRISDEVGALNLSQGFPDFPPPKAITDRLREGGLEPPRPEWTLEPESSESTNSTTRACCQLSYSSI